MARALLFTILCVAAAFPSVSGTATLTPKLSSATCTGHLQDIQLTSITCDYSNDGCTYGSEVFVTGQVTSNSDLPRPMKLSVWKTLPSLPYVGTRVYSTEVEDVCSSGALTAYPDEHDDTYDFCPGAGVYNFNFRYENFGTRDSWFAAWSGYTYGMAVHIKHEGGGSDFGTCIVNVHASRGGDDSYATNTFVAVSALGLAGVCASMFVKRRKERLHQSEERRKELATHFELVQDSGANVV